ncbi:carboxypeptidase-like regulatory domain-containing protein [uncultured Tenacibaculum sp.]|uniref:carboxypeptidase-like regulatory domain-containing protein n=1 Tax=uncultured Tenacibaculum sp. TaxID=174713 RepID=UPI00261FAF53|nr:carboxypeptidase-like regulatory domain-containing protein [uncultured Tenacibaculum sp.]
MNLHRKHILLLIFSLQVLFCFAQKKVISGKITDLTETPIEGAAVILYDTSKKIIEYTVTNDKGYYEINSTISSGYTMEVSHIAFLKKQYSFTNEDLNKSSLTINFTLEENLTSLDEVILVSSKKAKDTVKLDLDKLNLYDNDNLKDILNKIPNFRLSDDGTIIYKGKNIDKILVNKKPSFENQNSIALENIENKIIEGISVINNYNDDFSLDFDEEEESVLNIDTKNENQTIVNGSLEAKYGYDNKYEIRAKGFLFSSSLNAFLTQNTNNIGKATIKSNEIKKLFSEGQPFSPYQAQSLGMLFATNENLQKDFFSSTNLTLRNQTQRFKTSGIFYHFAPDRINSVLQNTSTLENENLLNTTDNTRTKTQSFLAALGLAYKVSDKTILSYNLNANYIDDTNKSTVENELFNNGTPSGNNTTFSNNLNEVFSGFHQLNLKSKIRQNLILEAKAGLYHEGTNFFNDYTATSNTNSISEIQDYKFDKNEFSGGLGLRLKVSEAFIPLLTVDYYNTQEKIFDKDVSQNIIDRDRNNYVFNLKIRGNDVIKKGLGYQASFGVDSFTNILNNNSELNDTFIPMSLWIDYDRKMHRYFIGYDRERRFNELESGINTLQPFNSIWNGNLAFPLGFNFSDELYASYNYDNLFDAEIFSLSVSYKTQNNSLQRAFVQQQNGITEYELFIADKSRDYSVETFYSKTVAQIKFPTKVDLSLSYTQSKFPSKIAQQDVTIQAQNIAPRINIETITDNFINFSLSTRLSFITDEVENLSYDSRYSSSAFSLLFKDKSYKGNISFLYDNNLINNTTFSRKNINLGFEYTREKITYSIEGRHIGELLGFFENDAYNSQFIIRNGITTTLVNNQSLNYIIAGIKFNF